MDNQENKVLEVTEQVEITPQKKKRTSLIVLGALAVFFYLAITIFGFILLFDALNAESDFARGISLVLVIILVIGYGTLANIVPIGLSIAGLIVSIKKKKKYGTSKLWVVGFAIMMVLPIITEVLMLVIIKLVA
ncbi:MAG: hypothetical protein IJC07_03410 [Clostridia bacterium]|nr:hypothetical protein [Clostridia bacterium]